MNMTSPIASLAEYAHAKPKANTQPVRAKTRTAPKETPCIRIRII